METVLTILKFLSDLYFGYISFFINLLSFVKIDNPLIGIILAHLPLYATIFSSIARTTYRKAIFSLPNILYTIFFSLIILWLSDDWTKFQPILPILFIGSIFSGLEISGEQQILGKTIETELDKFKKG